MCCIKHIKQWCTLNNLKLNDEKTDELHITSRFRSRLQLPTIKVDSSPIVPSDKVKNPGVIFDRHMVMDRFVSLKCKPASFRGGSSFFPRGVLTPTTMRSIVHEPRSGEPIFCLLFWTPVSDVFLASTNGMMAFFYAQAMSLCVAASRF